MTTRDVTPEVRFGNPDDESLPLTSCLCGAEWKLWDGPILSVYADDPTECPQCHRRFYFSLWVRVFEVPA